MILFETVEYNQKYILVEFITWDGIHAGNPKCLGIITMLKRFKTNSNKEIITGCM